MIHLVFNEADVEKLQSAISENDDLQGEVLLIADEYATGPIHALHTDEGRSARHEWHGDLLRGTEYFSKWENKEVNDYATIDVLKEKLEADETEEIWVWVAPNAHDIAGYYFLLEPLKDYMGRIMILNLSNLPFINDNGAVFYPEWLLEIPVKEFAKAKKLARPIAPSEFETDPDEWTKLGNEHKLVRRSEGGKKLVQHDESFFDKELKSYLTKDFQKTSKVFGKYFSKSKLKTGDVFLLWRLRKLAEQGAVELNDGKKIGDYEVRLTTDN